MQKYCYVVYTFTILLTIVFVSTVYELYFISNESLSMVQQHFINCIQYTFLGCNQSKSIIDHFIVSENIERCVQEYYTKESVDNLSDHAPLYMLLVCTIVDVSLEQDDILKEKPIWNLANEKKY